MKDNYESLYKLIFFNSNFHREMIHKYDWIFLGFELNWSFYIRSSWLAKNAAMLCWLIRILVFKSSQLPLIPFEAYIRIPGVFLYKWRNFFYLHKTWCFHFISFSEKTFLRFYRLRQKTRNNKISLISFERALGYPLLGFMF